MIRTVSIAWLGSMLGLLLAFSMPASIGIAGFSGNAASITVGYASSMSIGALVGLAAGKQSGFSSRLASAGAGSALALLMTFVLRALPLPWVNLVWLDGTAGPMSELPFVLLPVVGLILGSVFGAALRTTRKAAP